MEQTSIVTLVYTLGVNALFVTRTSVQKEQKNLEYQRWKNMLLEKKGVSLMLSNARKQNKKIAHNAVGESIVFSISLSSLNIIHCEKKPRHHVVSYPDP
jgi:hypothetical protein